MPSLGYEVVPILLRPRSTYLVGFSVPLRLETGTYKQVEWTASVDQRVGIQELTLVDLDAVAGGKAAKVSGGFLLKACAQGRHFREATIT